MPEGPEVARYVNSLNAFLGLESQILDLKILSGRYLKKPIEGLENLKFPLIVDRIACKGKFIYWTFKNCDYVLFNTLGMSGSWSNRPSHARVSFSSTSGSLYFNDIRNFGTLKICSKKDLKKKLKSLGPDMLSENVSYHAFVETIGSKPGKTLAEVLMDQSVISGVGNYLKSDSLWLARLSPHRSVDSLTASEAKNLFDSIRSTIKAAYENGGSTISTYKNFDGDVGNHRMLVYGNDFDPLGNPVTRETTKDGRTTWWCPSLQY